MVAGDNSDVIARLRERPRSGTRALDVLAALHAGLPVASLRPLLLHEDVQLVHAAEYVAWECPDAEPLLPELVGLLEHVDRRVRRDAVLALSNSSRLPAEALASVARHLMDVSDDVACEAIDLLSFYPIARLVTSMERLPDGPQADVLKKLLAPLRDVSEIREALVSGDAFAARVALAVAQRRGDDQLLFLGRTSPDRVVVKAADWALMSRWDDDLSQPQSRRDRARLGLSRFRRRFRLPLWLPWP